jgi:uncharacterized protein
LELDRATKSSADRWAHLRGHILNFGPSPRPDFSEASGLRLLLIVVVLEGLLGPRLSILKWLRLPSPPDWIRVLLLLALALVLLRAFAGVRYAQIGLRPWREWSLAEKSYFIQICVIANIVFAMILAPRLSAIAADSTRWGPALLTALTYLVWGFYQELVYRGMLQSELTRRWGAPVGILVANVAYTFGPLHFYHLSGPAPAPMFAAIFAIGLFFGVLFARSGNLWMVGIFHGIGDAYLTGLGSLKE